MFERCEECQGFRGQCIKCKADLQSQGSNKSIEVVISELRWALITLSDERTIENYEHAQYCIEKVNELTEILLFKRR